MPIRAKVRPVGTSLGIILPKRELDARGIKDGDTIEIHRLVRPGARDLFGIWKETPERPKEAPA